MNAPSRISKFVPELWPAFLQFASLALYILAVRDFYKGSGDLFYPLIDVGRLVTLPIIPIVGIAQLIYGTIRYCRSRHRKYLLHVLSFVFIVAVTSAYILLFDAGGFRTV